MNFMEPLNYIRDGLGMTGSAVVYQIGACTASASNNRIALSAGMRHATGSECVELGRRVAHERSKLHNNDHDIYHYAPKLLEMIAFERGEMP